jgi:hypothetical protein
MGRKFESRFLQREISCEPGFYKSAAQFTRCGLPSAVGKPIAVAA